MWAVRQPIVTKLHTIYTWNANMNAHFHRFSSGRIRRMLICELFWLSSLIWRDDDGSAAVEDCGCRCRWIYGEKTNLISLSPVCRFWKVFVCVCDQSKHGSDLWQLCAAHKNSMSNEFFFVFLLRCFFPFFAQWQLCSSFLAFSTSVCTNYVFQART